MRGQQLTAFEKYTLVDGGGGTSLWMVDWRKYGLSRCSLYVICPENGWPCKIGISVAPRKRLNALQTSVWKRLKVAGCYWLPTAKEARQLEKAIHETLTDDNIWLHGEWFDMRPEQAMEIVEFKAEVLGLYCSPVIEHDEALEDVIREIRDAGYYRRGFNKSEKMEEERRLKYDDLFID